MRKRAMILRAVVSVPRTYTEICAATGLAHSTVAAWVRELRKAKLVSVYRWERDARGYPTIPRFWWNPDTPDALRPSIPPAERTRASRLRAKGVRHEIV